MMGSNEICDGNPVLGFECRQNQPRKNMAASRTDNVRRRCKIKPDTNPKKQYRQDPYVSRSTSSAS